VISNLVSNALDAVAGVEPPKIVVALAAVGDHAEVRVEDNGPGVTDALRERLFTPFVTGKPSGVGMGLSISQKIARAHGGDVARASPCHCRLGPEVTLSTHGGVRWARLNRAKPKSR
jgi:C4-dicarboxylate-specific signal transduction histidine kinase